MINKGRKILLSGIYLFLYLPIFVMIIFSFNSVEHSLIWHGFSVHWYHQFFHDTELMGILFHSCVLALCSSVLALLFGFFAAYFVYERSTQHQKTFSLGMFVLILVPDLILAVAFLAVFRLLGIPFGFWTLLIAHATFCAPFVFVTILGSFKMLNPSVMKAAIDAGATTPQVMGWVLVPLLRPAIILSILMSIALSLDDVVISYFVSGPSFEILPLRIFAMARLGGNPEINAMCTILFAVSVLLVAFSQCFAKKERR